MRPSERVPTLRLLDAVDWLDVTEEIADIAGSSAQQYRRSHPGVDPVDFIIAATSEHHTATLWTLDVKHFPMVADLRPPY